MVDWVLNLNFIPIPIPNGLVDANLSKDLQQNLDEWLKSVGIDVILLSGGNNIGEERLRDATEEYLVFWAEKYTKPLLEFAGECR